MRVWEKWKPVIATEIKTSDENSEVVEIKNCDSRVYKWDKRGAENTGKGNSGDEIQNGSAKENYDRYITVTVDKKRIKITKESWDGWVTSSREDRRADKEKEKNGKKRWQSSEREREGEQTNYGRNMRKTAIQRQRVIESERREIKRWERAINTRANGKILLPFLPPRFLPYSFTLFLNSIRDETWWRKGVWFRNQARRCQNRRAQSESIVQ